MMEQQKGLAKKLRLAWNWWLLFLLLMFALSILGYAVDGAFGIVVVCTASAIALLCGFSSPRTPKLVMRLGDSNSLIRQQAFKQILGMPREEAISHFAQALRTTFPVLTLSQAHKLAVEGLGLLKAKEALHVLCEALKHPSMTVRAKAVWALGEIGDPSAAPYLIPLLGEGDAHSPLFKSQNQMISEQAAEALQKLGEGKLVMAFRNALKGQLDENSKQQLKGKYRHQIAQAFVRALLNGNAPTATRAAQAIGELLLVEALPALERKVRSPFAPSEVRKTCREAIAKLRSFANLPAIPSFSPETMNLPSLANVSEIETSNLPCAANLNDNEPIQR